jgi:hypothetical protein
MYAMDTMHTIKAAAGAARQERCTQQQQQQYRQQPMIASSSSSWVYNQVVAAGIQAVCIHTMAHWTQLLCRQAVYREETSCACEVMMVAVGMAWHMSACRTQPRDGILVVLQCTVLYCTTMLHLQLPPIPHKPKDTQAQEELRLWLPYSQTKYLFQCLNSIFILMFEFNSINSSLAAVTAAQCHIHLIAVLLHLIRPHQSIRCNQPQFHKTVRTPVGTPSPHRQRPTFFCPHLLRPPVLCCVLRSAFSLPI